MFIFLWSSEGTMGFNFAWFPKGAHTQNHSQSFTLSRHKLWIAVSTHLHLHWCVMQSQVNSAEDIFASEWWFVPTEMPIKHQS